MGCKNSLAGTTIIAVEPVAVNIRILKKNIRPVTHCRIKTINCAVAAFTGQRQIFLSRDANHSLFSVETNPLSSDVAVSVPALTLEDIISGHLPDTVSFLKMDCEGAEYEILMNSKPEVLSRIRAMCIEFHDLRIAGQTGEQLLYFLQSLHFDITGFHYLPSSMGLKYGLLTAVNKYTETTGD